MLTPSPLSAFFLAFFPSSLFSKHLLLLGLSLHLLSVRFPSLPGWEAAVGLQHKAVLVLEPSLTPPSIPELLFPQHPSPAPWVHFCCLKLIAYKVRAVAVLGVQVRRAAVVWGLLLKVTKPNFSLGSVPPQSLGWKCPACKQQSRSPASWTSLLGGDEAAQSTGAITKCKGLGTTSDLQSFPADADAELGAQRRVLLGCPLL